MWLGSTSWWRSTMCPYIFSPYIFTLLPSLEPRPKAHFPILLSRTDHDDVNLRRHEIGRAPPVDEARFI